MIPPIQVSRFGRCVSSLEGKADISQPVRMVNFLCYAAKLKFRYGYTPIQASPVSAGQAFNAYGFAYVQNRSGVAEFVGVENENGTINAYVYDKTTLARTAVGSSVAGNDWFIFSYADNAYLVNPGATKTVYRHVIGDPTSLKALEDSGYTDQSNPLLTITPNPLGSYGNGTGDSYAITLTGSAGINAGIVFAESSGVLTVSASGFNRVGQHRTTVENTFAASQDWSGSDYVAFTLAAGVIYINWERTNIAPQIKYGGTWHTLASTEFKEYFSTDNTQVTIVARIKGIGGSRTAIQGFRVTCGGATANTISGTVVAFTLQPVALGGCYLEASNSSHRPWDGNLDSTTIQYGVRYKNPAGPVYSTLITGSIGNLESYGFHPTTFSCAIGGKIVLSTPTDTSGTYTNVEFSRLMQDGVTWKIIGTVAIAGAPQFQDPYEEDELSALTTTPSVGVTITPTPVFRTAGIVGGFSFKQFVIWLVSGGSSNVQMSRVGNAEELYSSLATYDANDLTQPGQRTLSDDGSDEPVWGCQAGDTAIIVGKRSAYVMNGNYPVQMSPTRQIAGSRGIIGRFAGVRYRILGGQYAAAYCDPDFNIWAVEAVPQFAGDGRGQPTELSLPVRGLVKSFLYDEQLAYNPSLSKSQVQLEFDEETSSLWVILGQRAAVYRQDMGENGWEFFYYNIQTSQGSTTVTTTVPFFNNNASATTAAPGSVDWVSLGNATLPPTAHTTSGPIPLGVSQTTKVLSINGYTPAPLIPATATINSVQFEVERSVIGDLTCTETKVQPKKSGANFGADQNISYVLTSTDNLHTFTLGTLPSVSDINSGSLGLDLQYSDQDSNADWNNPAKWSIVVTNSTSASMTIAATYTGAGTVPTFVYVNVTSSVSATAVAGSGPNSFYMSGNITVNDGLNALVGLVSTTGLPGDPAPGTVAESETWRVQIPLSGGTGSITIVRSASLSLLSGSGWVISATYTGSAVRSDYVLNTVYVDNVNMNVTYTVSTSSTPLWVGWGQTCFTPDGKRIAIRTTGEIDIVEKDFRNSSYIVGTNRDGGYAPPQAEWWSQNIDFTGGGAQLRNCQINTTYPTDTPSAFSKVSNGSWVGSFQTGYSTSRWWRFPLSQSGIHFQLKLTLPETLGGIETLSVEFDQTSKSRTR